MAVKRCLSLWMALVLVLLSDGMLSADDSLWESIETFGETLYRGQGAGARPEDGYQRVMPQNSQSSATQSVGTASSSY